MRLAVAWGESVREALAVAKVEVVVLSGCSPGVADPCGKLMEGMVRGEVSDLEICHVRALCFGRWVRLSPPTGKLWEQIKTILTQAWVY